MTRDPWSVPPSTPRCGRAFFRAPADVLAPRLIGCVLVRLAAGRVLAGRVVEAEAYLGVRDAACHTFRGRRTARTEAMYGPAGTAYVYFTYGMHHCMNVVCGEGDGPLGGGVGEAVLLRALEPVQGLDAMAERRGLGGEWRTRDLCRGPGRLCQALGLTAAHSGHDMVGSSELFLVPGDAGERLARDRRVGLSTTSPWARRLLRWYIPGCEHVSAQRQGPIMPRARPRVAVRMSPKPARGRMPRRGRRT